jgi:hypothetical protein
MLLMFYTFEIYIANCLYLVAWSINCSYFFFLPENRCLACDASVDEGNTDVSERALASCAATESASAPLFPAFFAI